MESLNPDTRRYTWRRKRPEIQCRLDFFLVTESLMCNVKSANISTGYKTDHSLIEIKIALHSNMRGPGFWKLNTSLLTEIDYVNQIRKLLFDLELRNFGGEAIFRGNLSKEDLSKYIKISDSFTLEILQIWSDIKYEANILSIEQLKAHNLWQNSLIRVGNRPIHYRSWSSKGVTTVGHLMKDDNNFLSFSDFTERYDIETNFLTFQGVISAVKSLWKSNEANLHNENAIYESFIDTFLKTKKPNRPAYKILVSKKQKRPITAQRKWVTDCMLETQENIDWKTVYRTPFLCTKITKLIVFQFKLLHRRLATNSFSTKINLKDNEQCTFCQNDKETLIHPFWTCQVSILFWQGFKQWAINRGELSNITNLSPCLVLGLKPNKNKSINFYFLIARYFIWTCKMRNISPKIENFPLFLSHYDTTKTFS